MDVGPCINACRLPVPQDIVLRDWNDCCSVVSWFFYFKFIGSSPATVKLNV